jgi:hypothetical protein
MYIYMYAGLPLPLKKYVHSVWICQAPILGQAYSRYLGMQNNFCLSCKYTGIYKIKYNLYKLLNLDI